MQQKKAGFTLIEVLIVIAIGAILTITMIVLVSKQRTKAQDAATKSDLNRLKTAFEDYYNDKNCYPPLSWFDDAGDIDSPNMQPYLNKIPYDKKTNLPYRLEEDSTGCRWFKLYGTLSNVEDPQLVALQTTDPSASTLGNYGVSSSNVVVSIFYDPGGPSSSGGGFQCQGYHNCTTIQAGQTCTPSYIGSNCDGSSNQNSCEGTPSVCN